MARHASMSIPNFPPTAISSGAPLGRRTGSVGEWPRPGALPEEDFLVFGDAEPFSYSNTVIDEMALVLDEEGKVVLDNIAINAYQIDKK